MTDTMADRLHPADKSEDTPPSPRKGLYAVNRSLLTVAVGFVLAGAVVSLLATPAHAERKDPVRVVQMEYLDGDPDHPQGISPVRTPTNDSPTERQITSGSTPRNAPAATR